MTTNKHTESSKGDGGPPPPPPPPAPGQLENLRFHGGNAIFKSGPLFISSKGIGWTSWKKRWFILTRTSLVFFRSDPSAIPQKGSEVNLTLGGIDLNNSGSVVVKAEKKLLTVLFPDGRDGRAFTLKAESSEDLYEWKTALENALAQAPSASLVMGQNGFFQNDQADGADGSLEQLKDKQPVKSLAIGRPILLALEDVDGSPSFLEKALRFIEDHGIKVEGILRQAADVDDVEHRIKEFEQGKTEFSPKEDAHVIADCVKYFLRELPSSPVPTSCCNALLEACRTDRGSRVNAMRAAICETFPEPNRHLLQRILLMMQTVASHKAANRMSTSAVAACMAPLLLRPLLAGDCEIESNFNVGGDGSIQLLKAAAAANHAQAIVITLLEEYEKIFSEGSMSPGLYSDSDECGSEDEEVTDDDESYVDDATEESDVYTDEDHDNASSGTCTQSGESGEDDPSDYEMQGSNDCSSGSKSPEPEADNDLKVEQKLSSSPVQTSSHQHDNVEKRADIPDQSNNSLAMQSNKSDDLSVDVSTEKSLKNKTADHKASPDAKKPSTISNGPVPGKRPTVWGRTSAKKNLSMESIDYPIEDDVEIQKLEASKIELQNRIFEEIKGNAILQAKLEKRKKALHEHRQALQQDVARLQKQLQKERDKRKVLEAELNTSKGPLQVPVTIDENIKADLEEITQADANVANLKWKVNDLGAQLNQQHEQHSVSMHGLINQPMNALIHEAKWNDEQKDAEATGTSQFRRPASKDTCMDGTETQQLDSAHSGNSRPVSSTNFKRSSTRSEGVNSTTSALTRLTSRLNFLKERRSQIANEIQNMDKGRGSDQNLEKSQGSETPSFQNLEKDKGLGKEGKPLQNSEKSTTSDVQSLQDRDGGQYSDGVPPQSLLSEKSYNAGKGQPLVPPRINSR
ncbi:rho GTPase-activating protein REN1-like isoform X1 [Populus alba x Populus x berolinensis]|uniref:Rho GTPase-activating protein REN1-like isoform X1 n=2 Tax=Populus TaxID=3689 RepID=A0AAD6W370_9ROSI|nr:rho GTPase-activating protein REN1-like isoform X1 [Populus alba]KAJ6930380.1 rho GTPase-activating protein REN1-like isoform X1 [Populus alba x Populus x berolinensis]KAJ6997608.1 rho GTPase-activating protein REN1-like isoform X1 [Populus alba x Populus x berolinensis]